MKKSINFNWLKCLSIGTALVLASCTQEETSEDLFDTTSQSNLSQNSVELSISSATATTEQSANPASNSIDNNDNSRWSGFGDSVDLILDLGSENVVDYLKIAYYKGYQRQASFDYYYSTDGESWTGGNSMTSSGNTESLETFDLEDGTARYIRLHCKGTTTGLWNSILDIEVFGNPDDEQLQPPTGIGTPNPSITYRILPHLLEAETYETQSGVLLEDSQDNNSQSVGWIHTGDYITYGIRVDDTGTHTFDFRIASRSAGVEFDIYQGNELVSHVSHPATGGWYDWETISLDVELDEGNQVITFLATEGGWNINWFIVGQAQ